MALVEKQHSDPSEPAASSDSEDIGTPGEPAPHEVRDYIVDETDLTAAEVEDAATTRSEACKYLTELSAYYLVALDHGLQPAEIFETVQRSFSLDIDALQPEMNSVDLTAEIARITVINTFDRDDGSTGKVCNLILKDDTGRCVLTLWDDATALTAELEDGDTIRIENGYSTEASDYCQSRFDCDVEVRLGDEGTLLQKQDDDWMIVTVK